MTTLEKLNLSSEKILARDLLINLRGGTGGDNCCYLYCNQEYMYCGRDEGSGDCSSAEVPDEDCTFIPGSCSQCPEVG